MAKNKLTLPKEMQELIDMKNDYQDKVKKVGQKAIVALFKDTFDAYPEVHSIRWSQYTPHFNDGDACTFGLARSTSASRKSSLITSLPDEEFDDVMVENGIEYVSSFSTWNNQTRTSSYPTKRHEELKEVLNQIENTSYSLEDVLESAFGDGVQVTVTRTSIDVTDYDHD